MHVADHAPQEGRQHDPTTALLLPAPPAGAFVLLLAPAALTAAAVQVRQAAVKAANLFSPRRHAGSRPV